MAERLVLPALLLALLLGSPLSAQTEETPKAAPEAQPKTPVALVLTLEQAVALAVRNDLDLRSALIDEQIAQTGVREALGAFDPTAFASLDGGQTENLFAANFPLDPSDPFSDTVTRIISTRRFRATLDAGVRGKLDTGMSYELTFNNEFRQEVGATGLNPIHTNTATLALTQPLLQDAWRSFQDAEIDRAHILGRQAHQDYRRTRNETVRTVQGSYLDLLFAQRDLELKKQSLEVADEQIKVTRLRVELGSLAPTELTSARSERARRVADLVSARAALERAQDELKRRVFDDADSSWDRPIIAEEKIQARPIAFLDDRQVRRLAEQSDPEVLRARLEVSLRERELDQARNQRKPRLDLRGQVSTTGLNDGFWRSWDVALGRDGAFNWSTGLSFEMPLGRRSSEARLARARLQVKKARVQLRNQRVQLMFEVRSALREVRVAFRSIEAQREATKLARQQLDDERLRLRTGQSTNFQVFQVEDELRQREREEMRALIDHRLALLDLVRVTGLPLSRMIDPSSAKPEAEGAKKSDDESGR